MNPDIVIENKHFRLLLGADCCPKSLYIRHPGKSAWIFPRIFRCFL